MIRKGLMIAIATLKGKSQGAIIRPFRINSVYVLLEYSHGHFSDAYRTRLSSLCYRVKRSLFGALGNNYARPARSRQGPYLSVKVALPSTARPALAELPRGRVCSLGKACHSSCSSGRLRSGSSCVLTYMGRQSRLTSRHSAPYSLVRSAHRGRPGRSVLLSVGLFLPTYSVRPLPHLVRHPPAPGGLSI